MKSKFILTIGLLAIVVGVATTGIALKSVQASVPADGSNGGVPSNLAALAIKKAANQATANSLRLTSQQITSNPSLSDLAKNIISDKLGNAANQLDPVEDPIFPSGGGNPGGFCDLPGQCVNENGP